VLPSRLRVRLGFSVHYAPELGRPWYQVLLREYTSSGHARNRRELMAHVQPVLDRAGLRLDASTDPGAIREVLVDREYDWGPFLADATTTVIDAGAQHGEFAILCALRGAPRVEAFEPLPETAALLRENLRLNGCDRVQVHEVALGDRTGELEGIRYDSMLVRPGPGTAGSRRRVPEVTLDSLGLLPDPSGPHVLLKVDVEGFEAAVLRGARAFILRYAPKIVVEVDTTSAAEVRAFLTATGYAIAHEKRKAATYLLFAAPQDSPEVLSATVRD
jgi:FkbM family methyltransferase